VPNAPRTIYQLKITIDGIKPPVWRRVLVPATVTLAQLHQIIQEAFGWWDYHLHEFTIDGVRYGTDDGEDWGDPPQDERRSRLGNLAAKGGRIRYTYDFGDNWEHTITVDDVLPAEQGTTYPRCIAGKRSRPPEDVGGTWGYAEFLTAIADPDHPEHEQLIEWSGGDFDPEHCDLVDINASLTPIRR
jgi:hypothetical protein